MCLEDASEGTDILCFLAPDSDDPEISPGWSVRFSAGEKYNGQGVVRAGGIGIGIVQGLEDWGCTGHANSAKQTTTHNYILSS